MRQTRFQNTFLDTRGDSQLQLQCRQVEHMYVMTGSGRFVIFRCGLFIVAVIQRLQLAISVRPSANFEVLAVSLS